jgi:hypothetical protein
MHSFLEGAKHFTQLEFDRDPTNTFIGMRLLQLSANESIDWRIDVLLKMCRGGPQPTHPDPPDAPLFGRELGLDLLAEFEPAVTAFAQDSDFPVALEKLLKAAHGAATQPASARTNPYIPETLRLAALDCKLRRQYVEAAEFADQAVLASERIAARFPAAPARAMVDRTGYLLLAFPDAPEKTLVSCRQAIASWPSGVDRRTLLKLKRSLAFYLLAAGDEHGARQQVESLGKPLTPQQMDQVIGAGLSELCQTVAAAFPPEGQPKWLNDRLQRSLELFPDWPATRWLAASLALSRKDSREAIRQLEALERVLGDPQRVAEALKSFESRFPQDSVLADYVKRRLASRPAAEAAEGPGGAAQIPPAGHPSNAPQKPDDPSVDPRVPAPVGGPATRSSMPAPESPFSIPPPPVPGTPPAGVSR